MYALFLRIRIEVLINVCVKLQLIGKSHDNCDSARNAVNIIHNIEAFFSIDSTRHAMKRGLID